MNLEELLVSRGLELALLATFWHFQSEIKPGSVIEYESRLKQKEFDK